MNTELFWKMQTFRFLAKLSCKEMGSSSTKHFKSFTAEELGGILRKTAEAVGSLILQQK